MKIEDRRPASRVTGTSVRGGARAGATPADAAGPVRGPAATAEIMGIPEAELTPKVRAAIMSLMREVESLRKELDRHKARLFELERLADQDVLVDVPNRRAFVRELARVLSYAERYGGEACLLFFDVNGLKQINDSFGHAAGDAALKQVAQLLIANVRESDVVGRLGGDEFGVILAQANEERAFEKAETLVQAVKSNPLKWEGQTLPLGVAFGICALRPGVDAAAALARADQLMYSQKASIKAQEQAKAGGKPALTR